MVFKSFGAGYIISCLGPKNAEGQLGNARVTLTNLDLQVFEVVLFCHCMVSAQWKRLNFDQDTDFFCIHYGLWIIIIWFMMIFPMQMITYDSCWCFHSHWRAVDIIATNGCQCQGHRKNAQKTQKISKIYKWPPQRICCRCQRHKQSVSLTLVSSLEINL